MKVERHFDVQFGADGCCERMFFGKSDDYWISDVLPN
jgi:hypothetical protein